MTLKMMVGVAIALTCLNNAFGGGVVDLTKQMRGDGVSPVISVSSVNAGDVANITDGKEETTLQFGADANQTIDIEIPYGYHGDKPFYLTGLKIVYGHLNSCCMELALLGWNDTLENWIELTSISLEESVYNSTIQIPGNLVGNYRRFQIQMKRKRAWNYVVKEIYLYGRSNDANPPIGKVIVQSENESVVSSLSHVPGEYSYVPEFPQQVDVFVAEKSVDAGESIVTCMGYIIETSVDAGVTWSEPVFNENVFSYSYAAVADEYHRITWKYTTSAKVHGDYYVDGNAGIDEDGNCHTASLNAIPAVLQNGKTVHLGRGAFVVNEEVLLSGVKDIVFEGAGKDMTFIEVGPELVSRHFRLLNCINVTFKNMTFRNGSVTGTESTYGGSVHITESTNIKFENCAFIDNKVTTTKDVGSGGAICTVDTSLVLKDCIFERNSVVAPRAMGGAVSSLSDADSKPGSIACTNTVFRYNSVSGTLISRGLAASFGGNAGGEFVNCLAVFNRSISSGETIGGPVFASNGYEGNSLHVAPYTAGSGKSNPLYILNSTVAYNQAESVVSAGYGDAVLEKSILVGQNKVANSRTWYHVNVTNCFYDNIQLVGAVTVTNSFKADVKMLPDCQLAPDSPAIGYGYTFPAPSTFVKRTLYVDPAAAGNGDGGKFSPFKSLTAALEGVLPGDEIILAQGRYTSATETFPIEIRDTEFVTIRGAGAGKTVFSNNLAEDGNLAMKIAGNFGLKLSGFSIEDHANVLDTNEPSAIYVFGGVRNEITDVEITGCLRTTSKSGVAIKGGHVWASNCQGLAISGLRIENCRVRLHKSNNSIGAGVIYVAGVIGLVENSAFVGNVSAASNISVLCLYTNGIDIGADSDVYAKMEFRNSLFAKNEKDAECAYTVKVENDVIGSGTGRFQNCTILGTLNKRILNFNAALHFENCIIAGIAGRAWSTTPNADPYASRAALHCKNTIIVTGDGVSREVFIPSDTSINYQYLDNPGFRNAANGNYSLKSDSPAIDGGELFAWMNPGNDDPFDWREKSSADITDLAGKPRISNKKVDIGCYEYQSRAGFILIVR